MLGCLLVLGSFLNAQVEGTHTPASEDFKAEVRRLVRQLDAGELVRRDAAEAELLRRGPAVLDLLPPPTDRTSAEVRQRLDRIRQKLQQQAADAAARPSLVTLKADAMPLAKVLAELSRQSGNAIIDQRGTDGDGSDEGPALKVAFDKTPFWPALDQVLDQAGLLIHPFAGSEKPAITVSTMHNKTPFISRVARSGRACCVGPFRIEPVVIAARRNLRSGDGALFLSVEALWEPRLRIIGLTQRMADVTASDEKGRPLPVANAEAQLEIPAADNASAVKFDLPFQLPSREVRRMATVKGKLLAMIPGRIETFRFDKLADAKDVAKRVAGVTVTLERVEKNNDLWEVRIRVLFDDAGDALASHRTWIFSNPAYLEGPDGKPITHDTYETTRQEKNEVGVAYVFSTDRPLDKLVFVYKTPGTIITSGFEYELKDIELP
jgi:hypothetical protein